MVKAKTKSGMSFWEKFKHTRKSKQKTYNKVPEIPTCLYCKKLLVDCGFGNNPEDCGLHYFVEWHKLPRVCNKCNYIITLTDRYLKRVIDTNVSERSLNDLEEHISSFKEHKADWDRFDKDYEEKVNILYGNPNTIILSHSDSCPCCTKRYIKPDVR